MEFLREVSRILVDYSLLDMEGIFRFQILEDIFFVDEDVIIFVYLKKGELEFFILCYFNDFGNILIFIVEYYQLQQGDFLNIIVISVEFNLNMNNNNDLFLIFYLKWNIKEG